MRMRRTNSLRKTSSAWCTSGRAGRRPTWAGSPSPSPCRRSLRVCSPGNSRQEGSDDPSSGSGSGSKPGSELSSGSRLVLGGAYDPAAGEPQIPVALQEEVHHPQREAETEHRLGPAVPLSHPHQRQRALHQVRFHHLASCWLLCPPLSLILCLFSSPSLRTIQIGTDSSNLNSEFCFILKVCFEI